MNAKPTNNPFGFTIIELIAVMAIIGVLAAVAIPNFSGWLKRYQADAQAQKVYYDLLLAKSTAIKNNNNVVVTFDATNHNYSIHDDTNGDGSQDAGEAVKSVDLEGIVHFALGQSGLKDIDANSVTSAIFLGGATSLTFNSRGEASTGGSIFLIPEADAGVSNNYMRSISIVQATGGVDLWNYDPDGSPGPWS